MSESCRRVLEIEIPPEVVKKRVKAVAVHLQRRVRLPGFRPGKAPISLIQQRFQDDIRSEVLQELVPEYIRVRAQEKNWEPIGYPSVSDVQFTEDTSLRFKAMVDILPEIQLGDYGRLTVGLEEPEVSEEEIAKSLERLQEQAATYVNLEARPLQKGDYASISFEGSSPGKGSAAMKAEEVLCEIGGANTVKEFTENLKGAQPGEERDFEVAYPAEFSDPRLAGKTIAYKVKVLGAKKKLLPDLNDDFAREVGEFETLDALRQQVQQELRNAKREEAEQNAKNQLRQQLVDLHDFPVPETMIERQMDRRVERIRRQLAAQKVDPESLQMDWKKMRISQRETALQEVKSTLILEKIAEKEKIEIEEADIEEEMGKLAAASQQTAAVVRSRLTREGALDKIKANIRIEKTLEFLIHKVSSAAS